ncbi:hypothetical protein MKW94_014787 [Papaver nudicaule]|uniref:Uncharacterized protein n=1 Tax=Papaver nudicaule TaxID=74823 RepID=A0AA41UVW3_PAPNU|nr:hypothetical protein [Papaver nudicaule]
MANRLGGFAKVLSTAKNSTRKEGFRRRFCSAAEKVFGDIDYRSLTDAQMQKFMDRKVGRELTIRILKAVSIGSALGLAIGGVYSYLVMGYYPFKKFGTIKSHSLLNDFVANTGCCLCYNYAFKKCSLR